MGRLTGILYTKRGAMLVTCLALAIGVLLGEKLGILPPDKQPPGVHLGADGREITVAGPFTAAVERAFRATLADSPGARVVRFASSPGGLPEAARAVRMLIQERRLDTLVSGACVSTCAVAFMGGRRRFWVEGARLGFQRSSLSEADGLSPAFLDKTHGSLFSPVWYPSLEDLRQEGVVTDIATPGTYPLVPGG